MEAASWVAKPVLALHEILCGGLDPDLTILLDNEVAFSVERARRRNRQHKVARPEKDENRFEQESRAFFGRVRSAYLAIAAREPQRVHVVNARGTPRADTCGYHGTGAEEVEDQLLATKPLALRLNLTLCSSAV